MEKFASIFGPALCAKSENGNTDLIHTGEKQLDLKSRRIMRTRITLAARLMFLVIATIAFCYFAAGVVVPVVLAVFTAMMLKPPVRWLQQCHVPAMVTAALVISVFVLTFLTSDASLRRGAL